MGLNSPRHILEAPGASRAGAAFASCRAFQPQAEPSRGGPYAGIPTAARSANAFMLSWFGQGGASAPGRGRIKEIGSRPHAGSPSCPGWFRLIPQGGDQHLIQAFGVDRFGDVAVHARRQGRNNIFMEGVGGHGDDGDRLRFRRMGRADGGRCRVAVQHRHLDIQWRRMFRGRTP